MSPLTFDQRLPQAALEGWFRGHFSCKFLVCQESRHGERRPAHQVAVAREFEIVSLQRFPQAQRLLEVPIVVP